MADTNLNVVQKVKFTLETDLDRQSKLRVGKSLKEVLQDAVITFDKAETQKQLKPVVDMVNKVFEKADMKIIDEGSVEATFKKIAEMSADTFQSAFEAAVAHNGGLRLSFTDFKLDDIVGALNKIEKKIQNTTSRASSSIKKNIEDINSAVNRLGDKKKPYDKIVGALNYKPKSTKTYNDSGTQTLSEISDAYDSAQTWEEKYQYLVKYNKEYKSYVSYLLKNKPSELDSFSSSKYGRRYAQFAPRNDEAIKALEDILVVKLQSDSGVLKDRQNELIDDRNRPWAREKTLQEIRRILQDRSNAGTGGGGGNDNNVPPKNDALPHNAETPKNSSETKPKSNARSQLKKYLMDTLKQTKEDDIYKTTKSGRTKEDILYKNIIAGLKFSKDISKDQEDELRSAVRMFSNLEGEAVADLIDSLKPLAVSVASNIETEGPRSANVTKNTKPGEQTRSTGSVDGDILKSVLEKTTVKVQVVGDGEDGQESSVSIDEQSLKNVLSNVVYNVHVNTKEDELHLAAQEYKDLVNGEQTDESLEKQDQLYEKLLRGLSQQDADAVDSKLSDFAEGLISSDELVQLISSKLPKESRQNRDSSVDVDINYNDFADALSKNVYKVDIQSGSVNDSATDNRIIELLRSLVTDNKNERGAFLNTTTGAYTGFINGEGHSVEATFGDYLNAAANGFDARIHSHTKKIAAPSGDDSDDGASDLHTWVKAFDAIKKQFIVTQKEILSFDFSGMTKEQLESIRDQYKQEVIQHKFTAGNDDELLQSLMRKSIERLMAPYAGALKSYEFPNAIDSSLVAKTVDADKTVHASIDQNELTQSINNAISDLAKDQTINDAKEAIVSAISGGAAKTGQDIDKETKQQIKQETGNQDQRFERLSDIASNYEDVDDIEAAIKQFGDVYKQIVLMSDNGYKYIKPNKSGINTLKKISSGDFDLYDYSGVEFQRVDRPSVATTNVAIDSTEITNAIKEHAIDTNDLAKEETLGVAKDYLQSIADNTKTDVPQNVVTDYAKDNTLQQILDAVKNEDPKDTNGFIEQDVTEAAIVDQPDIVTDGHSTSTSLVPANINESAEIRDMTTLLSAVQAVTDAVQLKTRAFWTEKTAVDQVVDGEISTLDELENKLGNIKNTLDGLINNIHAGDSDLAAGLSNINITVNNQDGVNTTAVGHVPATENTLLAIKSAVEAINSKTVKGTKVGGSGPKHKRTTKSDYQGSPFFAEKLKTREMELGKFAQQLMNSGRDTDSMKSAVKKLQDSLKLVRSGEQLSVWDQLFRQTKLADSIGKLKDEPDTKSKIEDYKQLIDFATQYYNLVERYEKAKDDSERKRVLGQRKDSIDKFFKEQGIDLDTLSFDDESYNKQLDDLRTGHKNNIDDIRASKVDKENERALKEHKEISKKITNLYKDLGKLEAEEKYASEDLKAYYQKKIENLEKEISAERSKTSLISDEDETQYKKTRNDARSDAEDKILMGRFASDSTKKQSDFKKLSENYEKLGKQRAIFEKTGNLSAQREADHLREIIDAEQKRLGITDAQIDALKKRESIVFEDAVKDIDADQNERDRQSALRKQVRQSREQARIGKARSAINNADDLIFNASMIDDVDASAHVGIQKLNSELVRLKSMYDKIQAADGPISPQDQDALVSQTRNLQAHIVSVKELLKQYDDLSGDNVVNVGRFDSGNGSIEKQLIAAAREATNGKARIKEFDAETNRLTTTVKTGSNRFTEFTFAVRDYDDAIVKVQGSTKRTESFLESIGRKTKEILHYFGGSSIIYRLFGEVRRGIQYVKEIDAALTELKKVTNETEASYDKFLDTASKTADKVGSTIQKIVSSTADWSRLGYSMEEAAKLAESTSVLLNVSEFRSIDEATSALTSTMQAFGYVAKDSMHVVDVLNEVGKLVARR